MLSWRFTLTIPGGQVLMPAIREAVETLAATGRDAKLADAVRVEAGSFTKRF